MKHIITLIAVLFVGYMLGVYFPKYGEMVKAKLP